MKKYIWILVFTFLLASVQSCSTIHGITDKITSGKNVNDGKGQKSDKNKAKKRGRRSENESAAAVSQGPLTGKNPKAFTRTDSIEVLSSLIGEWTIVEVGNVKISAEEDYPFLCFGENARMYAFNGCTFSNGYFHITGYNAISFSDIISNYSDCSLVSGADAISAAWKNVKSFDVTACAEGEKLTLYNRSKVKIMTLKRHVLSQLNGLWQVVAINNLGIEDGPTIVIDLPEARIHGDSGCNIFSGAIYQDIAKNNSVQFQDMKVTKRPCPNSSLEAKLLIALECVEHARILNDDNVTLHDSGGNVLITLRRYSPS